MEVARLVGVDGQHVGLRHDVRCLLGSEACCDTRGNVCIGVDQAWSQRTQVRRRRRQPRSVLLPPPHVPDNAGREVNDVRGWRAHLVGGGDGDEEDGKMQEEWLLPRHGTRWEKNWRTGGARQKRS